MDPKEQVQNTPVPSPVPVQEVTPPPTNEPVNQNPLNPLYEQAYRETAQENLRLKNLLEQQQAPVTQQTPAPNNDEYWNNPATFIRNTISEELRKTIKPFQENIEVDARQRNYQLAKNQIRNTIPYFSQIENEVDTIMAQANFEPNPQNIQLAISIALGARQMAGNTITTNPSPVVQPTQQQTNMIPPNIPPSNPPAPVPHPVNQAQPLTETERRIARERGMSEEEFIYYRDSDSRITSIPNFQEYKAAQK